MFYTGNGSRISQLAVTKNHNLAKNKRRFFYPFFNGRGVPFFSGSKYRFKRFFLMMVFYSISFSTFVQYKKT
ncbi:hypothetical protein DC498_23800 [Terrimonas sp.]|nr:hypothetical protein DC498_23800 [Terrimonas sp.]